MKESTIIATATPLGVSALALVRMSGKDSLSILQSLLKNYPKKIIPQHAFHADLYDKENFLDDAVCVYWKAPHSFTGEDIVEINLHGNPTICQNLLTACLSRGAKMARGGEFTERAFLSGKMDLTQAEAINDWINATTEHELASAKALKEGRLSGILQKIRTTLIDLIANIEASIDFSEEEIETETNTSLLQKIKPLLDQVQSLLKTQSLGKILREGVLTVIVGKANAGKSSLFNKLLSENRSIVSPLPGTTRDLIEGSCNFKGFRLHLMDTAGEQKTENPVEQEGIRRAHEALKKAELILHVFDSSLSPLPPTFNQVLPHQKYIPIANKIDLKKQAPSSEAIPISLKTGDGWVLLEEKIEQLFSAHAFIKKESWFAINTRHAAALQKAALCLEKSLKSLEENLSLEFISSDLNEALQAIAEVTGSTTCEDILDSLFENFCIGK